MTHYLITNSVTAESVREEQRDGDRYLIAEDVPFVRAMQLDGGYVPDESIRSSTGDWHGTVATLNHPRDDQGQPIAARGNDEVQEEFGLGRIESPRYDGEYIRGNIVVNADKAERMGGEALDVVRKLEEGDPLEVSSQYVPEPLSAGVYDGRYRENVEAIKTPDSVALLPNREGVCSLEHGCGFNPADTAVAANSAVVRIPTVNARHEEMDAAADLPDDGARVSWPSSGDRRAYGVVRDTISDGEYDGAIDGDVTVSAPAALIEVHRPTDDGWEATETMVAHKPGTLETVDSFPDASQVANVVEVTAAAMHEVPDAYRFENPGQAMGKAEELGFDDIHEHDGEDGPVFMPGPDHETLIGRLREMGELEGQSSNEIGGAAGTDDPTGARSSGTETANADRISYDGTADGTLDESAIPNEGYEPHYVFPADTKTESSFPLVDADGRLRRGNVAAAFRFRDDAPDTDALLTLLETVNDEFEEPPIEPESLEEAMTANTGGLGAAIRSFLGLAGGTATDAASSGDEPAESGVGTGDATVAVPVANADAEAGADGGAPTSTMSNRNELIDEIVANSPLTEESLEERCDDGLEAIHDDVMANAGEEPTENNNESEEYVTQDDLDSFKDELVDELTANQDREREAELAEKVVSNSTEYDDAESVREDFPTEAALETKLDALTSGPTLPGRGATTSQTPAANSEDADPDDFSPGVLN